jgi:Arc/MetJ family transcription regulator
MFEEGEDNRQQHQRTKQETATTGKQGNVNKTFRETVGWRSQRE